MKYGTTHLGVILTAVCLAAGGCMAVSPAVGDCGQSGTSSAALTARPETLNVPADETGAGRWPARWGKQGGVGVQGAGTPRGVIVPIEQRLMDLRPAHLGRFHQLRSSELEYRHAEVLARAVGVEDGFRFVAEGPGSLVFMPLLEGEDQEADQPGEESEVFVFISAQETADSTPDDVRVALERTWMALYDATTPEVKGTILLIPGMLGTPHPIIEGQIRHWRNSGYAVLRFLAHPARFTERVEVAIAPGEEEAVGRLLAGLYDTRTAECAYAADAAVEHVLNRRRNLRDKPVVLVGMSGGAMVMPTVYAYAPERYAAAVLIAGGANSMKISAVSNYAEWIDAVVLDWDPENPASTGKPEAERLERVSNAYLGASRLDATHTAPEMAGIPVLMLHASRDKAVPSATGDALWRLLERPERWSYAVGHEMIFVMLPTQAGRLQRWIDRAVGGLLEAGADEAGGGS